MSLQLEPVDLIQLFCRVPLAAMMALGSFGKLINFSDFREIVTGYNILPTLLVPLLSSVFVMTAFGVAVCLVFSNLAVWGGIVGPVLLLLYAIRHQWVVLQYAADGVAVRDGRVPEMSSR